VVDGATLGEARPHHPADIVSRVPGAWVANLSGEGHMTAIRQPITTKPVYAFMEDGVPIRSTGFFNHNALYEINLPLADRVEIIKGPGSALYGSDAIGGVISSYTRAPSERSGAELFVEGGKFGYARVLGTASGTSGRSGLRADLNLTRSDSYRDGAPYARQSGTLRWDQGLGSSSLKTVVSASHIDQPGDGGSDLSQADFDARPSSNYSPVAYRRVKSLRVSSTLEHRAGQSLISGILYGRYNELDLLPSWQLSFDPQIWESKNSSIGFLGRYRRLVPALRTSLSGGLDLEASPGSRMEQQIIPEQAGTIYRRFALGEVQYDYGVTFRQASPNAQAEISPIDRLRFDLGVRFDYVGFDYHNHLSILETGFHRRPGSTSVSYQRLSPKIGATFELANGVHLFGSYRAAFRAPSESQLFRQGSAASTVDLAPVTADNYEAGVRAAVGDRVNLEATVYRLDITNDILTFFDPTNGLRIASNAGATRHQGVELGLSVSPVSSLRLDGSWAFTRQRYREWQPSPTVSYDGKEIEVAPRSVGRLGVDWRPAFIGSGRLGAEWVHQGSYWMDPANSARYDGYDLFNLSATVPVTRQLELVGRIHNLTDRLYAETSSFSTLQGRRYRPGPPRTFYLGAQYRFGSAEPNN
jgi:outer membrane receptor protein involved in Fe transport